jgi:putative oxidoreductase
MWLGAMMCYHGYGKIFDYPADFIGFVSTRLQLSELFAWSAAYSELVGGALLVLGLFTRPAALSIMIVMLVAAFGVHAHDPWSKKEFALGYAIASMAFVIAGGGLYSIDNSLSKK